MTQSAYRSISHIRTLRQLRNECTVLPLGPCWVWTRHEPVLRHAYRIAGNPLPDDFEVVRTCLTPRCCNPAHLAARQRKQKPLVIRHY